MSSDGLLTCPGCVPACFLMTAVIDDTLTQLRNKWRLKEMKCMDRDHFYGLRGRQMVCHS